MEGIEKMEIVNKIIITDINVESINNVWQFAHLHPWFF